MDLKSFSSLSRVEKEFDVVDGLKISMHTLSVVQQQDALAELPNSPISSDPAFRTLLLQQALLVYALDSINGEKPSLQEKKEFIQNLQAPVFNAIYNCYDKMAQEQDVIMSSLDKKKVI